MLTLSQSRRIGSFTVLRDVSLEGGVARFTPAFYVMPDAPRFALEDDGGPAFHFTWFRPIPGSGLQPGGLATLTIDLKIPAEAIEDIKQKIPMEYGLPAAQVIEIRSPEFKAGTVELSFAGETGQGDFVNQLAGSGPARLSGSLRATFALDVTADGAALLWRAAEQRLSVIHARFDLVYDHRLAGVSIRVWCDAMRSYPRAEAWLASGGTDVRGLLNTLTENQLAGIELTSDEPIPPAYEKELQDVAQHALTSALASAMFSDDKRANGSPPKLRPYAESMQSTLNMRFEDSYTLESHAVLDSVLAMQFSDEQFRRRCIQVQAETGFFTILVVQLVCTVDFSRDLISTVKVTINYASGAVKRIGEFVFKDGAPQTQEFRSDVASPSERSFTYVVEVFYRGDPVPSRSTYGPIDTTLIILDLESVGVLNVRAALRNVPLDVVSKAVVALEYAPKGLSHTMILDGASSTASWSAVVRDGPTAYRYKTDWLLQNGTRIEGAWAETNSPALYLDAPAAIGQQAKLEIISAGDFSGLSQIIVDLRSTADNAETQFAFTRTGEANTWKPKRQSDGDFRYDFRRTLIYEDGSVRAADPEWVPSTRPILIISDELRFDVSVVTRLLDLGASLKSVIVELETDASQGPVQKKTFLVQNKTDQYLWTFRINKLDQHRYRYRITAISSGGQRKAASEWRDADSGILVLTPSAD